MPAMRTDPWSLDEVTRSFDFVAEFLRYAIDDSEQGIALRGMLLPASLAPVPLQLVRDVLGSVLDLMEAGMLTLLELTDDDGGSSFELVPLGIN